MVRYSAGTVILQVAPSFRGFQEAVEKRAKAEGLLMERYLSDASEAAAKKENDRRAATAAQMERDLAAANREAEKSQRAHLQKLAENEQRHAHRVAEIHESARAKVNTEVQRAAIRAEDKAEGQRLDRAVARERDLAKRIQRVRDQARGNVVREGTDTDGFAAALAERQQSAQRLRVIRKEAEVEKGIRSDLGDFTRKQAARTLAEQIDGDRDLWESRKRNQAATVASWAADVDDLAEFQKRADDGLFEHQVRNLRARQAFELANSRSAQAHQAAFQAQERAERAVRDRDNQALAAAIAKQDSDASKLRSQIGKDVAQTRAQIQALNAEGQEAWARNYRKGMESGAIPQLRRVSDGNPDDPGVREFNDNVDRMNALRRSVGLEVHIEDEAQAIAEYDALIAQLEGMKSELEIRPELAGDEAFMAEMRSLMARADSIPNPHKTMELDTASFNAEAARVDATSRRLSRRDITKDANLQTAGYIAGAAQVIAADGAMRNSSRQTQAAQKEAGNGAGTAANSFRAMNGALFAAVTIGPALIPILGGITAGLLGVAAGAVTVAGALGVGMLGLSGMGGALTALGNRDKDLRKQAATPQKSGTTAANDEAARAKRIRDALAGLTDARRNASRSEARAVRDVGDAEEKLADTRRSAADRVASAEDRLATAQQRAIDNQKRLNDARKEASRNLEDLAFQIRGANLAEQQSVYEMQRAGIRYNAVLEDDQATSREKDEARITYEQAVLANDQAKVGNQRLREGDATARAAGVEGAPAVVEAKEAISTGAADIVEAEKDLAEARVKGDRDVESSRRDLADALDALDNTRYNNVRSLQKAEEALAEAYRRDAAAAAQSTAEFDSSLFDLNEAMNNLSPAGQRFATWLYGLKPLLDELRFTAQETFLPGLQEGMQGLIDRYGPEFTTFVGTMGTALGDSVVKFSEWLTSPAMASFFETMAANMPAWLDIFTRITTGGLGGLLSIFEALAPAATTIGEAIAVAAEGFAVWAASEEGQEAIKAFGDYLTQIGPEVWALFASAIAALANAFIAMAPYGESVMLLLTGFFNFIADMDPATLALIIQGIFALIAAFQIVFTIGALVGTIMLGIGVTAALVIGVIALAVAAVIVFWDEIYAFLLNLSTQISAWYDKNLAPTFDLIAKGAMWLWENVFVPAFEGIGKVMNWLWNEVIWPLAQNIGTFWSGVLSGLQFFYNAFVIAWHIAGLVWQTLWDNYIEPLWTTYLEPWLNTIAGFIDEHVKPKWESGVKALGEAWDALKALVATPIKWVIEKVINEGIIDNFNDFAGNFPGTVKVNHVPVPGWMEGYATGGILPGYTPGRDVHRFRSATGGTLDLSGGEAILRPEVTQAVGPSWVHRVNALARSGGVSAVQQHLGGFATGGIIPSSGPRHQAFAGGGIWGSITDAVGGAAGMLGDVVDSVMKFVKDPAAALQTAIDGLLGNFVGGDTPFGSLVLGVPKKVIETATNYVKSIFTGESIAAAEAAKVQGGALAGLEAGGAAAPAVLPGDGGRSWANPTVGPITSRFGMRTIFGKTSLHAGTDIAGGGRTFAASSGTVRDVGWNLIGGRSGYGILLQHTPLLTTYYGHNPTNGVVVNPGQAVVAGQHIGRQGATGNVDGIHLHYEVATGGRPGSSTNPEPFMRARGIQLGRNAPLYDEGGYLQPGLNAVMNLTGKPEPVLTAQELEMFKQAADLRGGGGDGTSFDGANFYSYDPTDILDRAREERRRDLAMAGLAEIEVSI